MTEGLWTAQDAVKATQGKLTDADWQASRVVIDSRSVQPGDLFVALKGERFDGHEFVAQALQKGAVAAVVEKAFTLPDASLLKVDDTLAALEALGRYARKRCRAKIIGVTGSVGKTSTKDMLKLALSAQGATYATSGNYNNHIGTPLNLANLPPDMDFAVFEMGMNHAGEISHLTRMVRPDVALITTVAPAHLEFFPSVEAIADAKAEIFEGLPAGGIAVLNADNPYFARLEAAAKMRGADIIPCGEAQHARLCLLGYEPKAGGCKVKASADGHTINYTLGAIGKHWALGSLLVLAACAAVGADVEACAKALAGFSEPEGRGSIKTIAVAGGQALLVDDSYNASPIAMQAAFAKTAEVAKGSRLLAALGEMRELGETAPALHAALAEDLQKHGFNQVFTCGGLMTHLQLALPSAMRGGHTQTAAELLPLLRAALRPGDVLLVKGSHGSKIYELAEALSQEGTIKHAV